MLLLQKYELLFDVDPLAEYGHLPTCLSTWEDDRLFIPQDESGEEVELLEYHKLLWSKIIKQCVKKDPQSRSDIEAVVKNLEVLKSCMSDSEDSGTTTVHR
ncbi:hypothetical protein HDU76_006606 [Blyttiomyces sp. JEL0837]|nr:hypothetical protein HDU76_006606 [Blyttiomyces sp. JEL0837]